MTTVQLVALICAALLFQVAVGAGVMVWRRRAAAPQIPQLDKAGGRALSAGAWEGWRDFRVTSRAFEDVARSQCSFYLQPVDGKPLAPFRPGQYITLALR